MSRNAEQKIKLLVLYEILQKRTDEMHPLTTGEIIAALKERGITSGRKTVYEDIELLNRYGYEVMCNKGRSNRYYVGYRSFERSEIQVLMSAIGAARFITEKKTKQLTEKLSELLGGAQAEELYRFAAHGNKRNNERVYYSIDTIIDALKNRRKLTFQYFDYGIRGEKIYRKDKERYEVNPLGMIYSEDNIYLVCYHDKYRDTANYRIDRMEEVRVEEAPITEREEYKNFNLDEYRRETFSMYAGELEKIKIVFPKELLEVIQDRFGTERQIISIGNNEYETTAEVRLSKTFFAWLTTFEGRVSIKSPESVREKYIDFIHKLEERLK